MEHGGDAIQDPAAVVSGGDWATYLQQQLQQMQTSLQQQIQSRLHAAIPMIIQEYRHQESGERSTPLFPAPVAAPVGAELGVSTPPTKARRSHAPKTLPAREGEKISLDCPAPLTI